MSTDPTLAALTEALDSGDCQRIVKAMAGLAPAGYVIRKDDPDLARKAAAWERAQRQLDTEFVDGKVDGRAYKRIIAAALAAEDER